MSMALVPSSVSSLTSTPSWLAIRLINWSLSSQIITDLQEYCQLFILSLLHIYLPVVTGNVVPADAVVIFVVEDGQARLVMELLQPLDGDADVVLGVDGPVLDALKVVRLPLALPAKHQDRDDDTPCHTSHLLSSGAPEGLSGGGAVGRGDAGVAGSGPEPPVDDDGGEVRGVAALVLEVALPAAGVHRGDVI